MTKEYEIMDFLHRNVFNQILQSPQASKSLKQGVRQTINRMKKRDAEGMIKYYWATIIGTERSICFSQKMKEEGFNRFEEVLEEFRLRFNDDWLNS